MVCGWHYPTQYQAKADCGCFRACPFDSSAEGRLENHMLGSAGDLEWSFDAAKATVIRLPARLQEAANRPGEHAWSLKLQQSGA